MDGCKHGAGQFVALLKLHFRLWNLLDCWMLDPLRHGRMVMLISELSLYYVKLWTICCHYSWTCTALCLCVSVRNYLVWWNCCIMCQYISCHDASVAHTHGPLWRSALVPGVGAMGALGVTIIMSAVYIRAATLPRCPDLSIAMMSFLVCSQRKID
jgi:hypothetical protein